MSKSIRILAIGDTEVPYLWDFYQPGRLDGIDLILAAGDLDPEYLSFLATFCRGPVLYVHGNHDGKYEKHPPEGCECIEDTVYRYKGLRIVGFGGSIRYSDGAHQYTETQMKRRIRKAAFSIRRAGGCDILLTHAPAFNLHDGDDRAHKGFVCFQEFLDAYQPKCFVHCHVHANYGEAFMRTDVYKNTRVINAYERYLFDIPLPEEEESIGVRQKLRMAVSAFPKRRALNSQTPEGQ